MAENDSVCRMANQAEDMYDYIIEWQINEAQMREQYPGVCIEEFSSKYTFLHVPSSYIGLQGDIDRSGYSSVPKLFGLMDTSNVETIGALRLQNQPVLNLRGQGVMIGFVDTGIAYDLPIFRNEDGTSRILGLWDQTVEDENAFREEEGVFVSYGHVYTNGDLNRALAQEDPYTIIPSRDEQGHGTFLAGIAAGKRDAANDFTGIAPDSSLAVVKLKPAKQYLKRFFGVPQEVTAYSEIDIMNGVKYLLELAVYYHRPIIICIGLGTNQGGHDGRMPISDYLSQVSDTRGLAVVQAAGNEGNARRHYYGRIEDGTEDVVEIKVGENTPGFVAELWADSLSDFAIGLVSPGGETIDPVLYRIDETRRYQFPLEGSAVYVSNRAVKLQGGDYLVQIRFVTPSAGIWKIRVKASGNYQTQYHIWMPITQFVNEETYFLSSNPYTTVTSNACAMNTITVGMYNHYLETLTPEGSKGYTRVNQIKPDILAPGVNIYGPAVNGSYTVLSGSSVAAAHGAGAAALVMEYGAVRGNLTYMDGEDIRNLMIRAADRKPSLEYPNRDWGYGTLNVYQIFIQLAI